MSDSMSDDDFENDAELRAAAEPEGLEEGGDDWADDVAEAISRPAPAPVIPEPIPVPERLKTAFETTAKCVQDCRHFLEISGIGEHGVSVFRRCLATGLRLPTDTDAGEMPLPISCTQWDPRKDYLALEGRRQDAEARYKGSNDE